ncbi:hypothetical protein KVMX100_140349 [Klebsiella variicola]|nr:hypothetical protein KVMX100_140349 [Klebsiella variicola]
MWVTPHNIANCAPPSGLSPSYSACVYIPFMFQQCDKRYTDAFQGVSAASQHALFHNNLIFKTMLLYLHTAFF